LKVLIKNFMFSGGAPRSLLEYGKVFVALGYDVLSLGEYVGDDAQELYNKAGIRTINIKSLKIINFLNNIVSIFKLIKIVKEEKPDLIISITGYDAVICSSLGACLGIPVIIVVAGGAYNGKRRMTSMWKNNHVIVFSHENISDLVSVGYDEDKIMLISNRIKANIDMLWQKHYQELINLNITLKLLITSRLTKTKMSSVVNVLDIFENLLESEKNIQLDIIGDGDAYELIKHKAEQINNKFKKNFIHVLGHKNNINSYFEDAHIFFGKGRSVIEPIMKNRIGIVIGDNKSMSICNEQTFDNLFRYNFSGRDIRTEFSQADLKELILNLRLGTFPLSSIIDTSSLVSKYYDISKVEDILIKLCNKVIKNEQRPYLKISLYFNVYISYLLIYVNIILRYIAKRSFRT